MSRIVAFLLGASLWLWAASLPAQDTVLNKLYGNGVHAYFAGDYVRAHYYLTAAINGRTQDPRCYYFRGLAYGRLGRPQEAEVDFQQGAKLETSDLNRSYDVAKVLERVQGGDRLSIEQYRFQARVAAMEQSEKSRARRYDPGQPGAEPTGTERVKTPPGKPAEAAPPAGPGG